MADPHIRHKSRCNLIMSTAVY